MTWTRAKAALLYRWRVRWWPRVLRWTLCVVRGHDLGQIGPLYRKGWSFHRPCKRCRVEVGCSYESMRGIYEYEPGVRHNGRYGLDMLVDEATEAQRWHAPLEEPDEA